MKLVVEWEGSTSVLLGAGQCGNMRKWGEAGVPPETMPFLDAVHI